MFNFFFNWLDPKILNMERWINKKVIEPDKMDTDLDKVKKGEVRKNDMFNKSVVGSPDEKYGPFITNMTGAKLISFVYGPGSTEAFSLHSVEGTLWWRHRDAGSTQDFAGPAFDDMREFMAYINIDIKFWDCVLRTQALLDEYKGKPLISVTDIPDFMKNHPSGVLKTMGLV